MQSALDVRQDTARDGRCRRGRMRPGEAAEMAVVPRAAHSLCEVWRGTRRNGDSDGDGGRGVHCDG